MDDDDFVLEQDKYNECGESLEFISAVMKSCYSELIPKLAKDYNLNIDMLKEISKNFYVPLEETDKAVLLYEYKSFKRISKPN